MTLWLASLVLATASRVALLPSLAPLLFTLNLPLNLTKESSGRGLRRSKHLFVLDRPSSHQTSQQRQKPRKDRGRFIREIKKKEIKKEEKEDEIENLWVETETRMENRNRRVGLWENAAIIRMIEYIPSGHWNCCSRGRVGLSGNDMVD